MLKSVKVEIKKEDQVLMVNKTTKFKKGKGKKTVKKDGKGGAAPGKQADGKKPKNGPRPETECFYCKESGQSRAWVHSLASSRQLACRARHLPCRLS